jgi:hypothetical protein
MLRQALYLFGLVEVGEIPLAHPLTYRKKSLNFVSNMACGSMWILHFWDQPGYASNIGLNKIFWSMLIQYV